MFISTKKKKNQISDPALLRKMTRMRSMYPPGNWRIDPFRRTNVVNKEYARKTKAAKIIQNYIRLLRDINRAKQLSPSNRRANNPLWKKFVNYQMKRANQLWSKGH